MGKLEFRKVAKSLQTFTEKHSPEILTGVGIAGMFTTVGLAINATTKAVRKIDNFKYTNGLDEDEKIPPKEVVKLCWKQYIPVAVTGTVSAACLIGASKVHLKRNAVLATAYKLSETALAEYKEKVVETIGEKKEQTVREKISKKRIEENPVSNNMVYVTGNGDSLFLEPVSKRYFKSDIERIRCIVNTLNERMYSDVFGHISLSDFYDELGLERTDISDEFGWSVEKGSIKVEFHPVMCDDENSPYHNKPCLAIYYITTPEWGYDS